MVENVVLTLHKSDTQHVKYILRRIEVGSTLSIGHQPADQMVSHLCLNEVLISPRKVNKLVLRREVETNQALHKLCLLDESW